MARLGVMTTEFVAPRFEDTVGLIAAHGIGCVQLQLGSVVRGVSVTDGLLHGLDVLGPHLTPELAGYCAEVLTVGNVTVAAVDGTYNMAHPDSARRARNLAHLLTLIDLAPTFGTDIVTLCTGTREDVMWRYSPANHTDGVWADLVAQLRVAARAAENAGVRLAFEPEHNNVVDSARHARRLIDEVESPALKVLMDGANLFHTGDLARMEDLLTEAFALIGGEIVLAHAKDLDHDGDAGSRAAGQGRLDYSLYLSQLQACGFDGAIVLHQLGELMPHDSDRAFGFVRDHAPADYLVGR